MIGQTSGIVTTNPEMILSMISTRVDGVRVHDVHETLHPLERDSAHVQGLRERHSTHNHTDTFIEAFRVVWLVVWLKSIRVHLDPGSQLVCASTQTLVIVTTVCILWPIYAYKSARAPYSKKAHGKGHIPLAVSGICILRLWDIQLTFEW